MPTLYVIAGCNGAGKTTASFTILPEILNCKEFVNADEIAKGLSPFQPEKVSFEAGRIMLTRIRELISVKQDFAFETTLSTKSYLPLLDEARAHGFQLVLFFLYLDSIALAKDRVALRVRNGGHFIPDDVIERRYSRGLQNLQQFVDRVDSWVVANNSGDSISIIAQGARTIDTVVVNKELWAVINPSK
jgi:predicted ABC-type ATPase